MRALRLLAGAWLGAALGLCVGAALGSLFAEDFGELLVLVFPAMGWGLGLGALVGLALTAVQTPALAGPRPKELLTGRGRWVVGVVGVVVALAGGLRPLIGAIQAHDIGLVVLGAVVWGLALGSAAATATLFLMLQVRRR